MSGIKRFENSNGLCINRKNMFSAFIWSLSRKILSIDGKVDIQSNSPLSSRMSCALKKHRSRRSSKWSSRPQNRCLSRQNPLKERKVNIRSNGADASSRDDHSLDLLLLDFFTVTHTRQMSPNWTNVNFAAYWPTFTTKASAESWEHVLSIDASIITILKALYA